MLTAIAFIFGLCSGCTLGAWLYARHVAGLTRWLPNYRRRWQEALRALEVANHDTDNARRQLDDKQAEMVMKLTLQQAAKYRTSKHATRLDDNLTRIIIEKAHKP